MIRLFQATNRLLLTHVSFPKCCAGGGGDDGDDGAVVVVTMVVLA